MDKLPELVEHVRRHHSPTQIKHFIVTKGGAFCDYGAFRQALREMHSRRHVVHESSLQIRELEIDIRELKSKAAGKDPEAAGRSFHAYARLDVELERKQGQLVEARRDLTERAHELSQFYGLACVLKDLIEEQHGEFTAELHDKLDFEMWIHRLKLDAAADTLTHGRPQNTTLRTIMSLPKEERDALIVEIAQPAELALWASQLSYTLPKMLTALPSPEKVIEYVANLDSACTRIS